MEKELKVFDDVVFVVSQKEMGTIVIFLIVFCSLYSLMITFPSKCFSLLLFFGLGVFRVRALIGLMWVDCEMDAYVFTFFALRS